MNTNLDPNAASAPGKPDVGALDSESYRAVKAFLLRQMTMVDRKARDARAIERVKAQHARK